MAHDLMARLQALLREYDELSILAAQHSRETNEPVPGAYYAGVMYGYEECMEKLSRLLSDTMAKSTVGEVPNLYEG
jgi:hypothetical protein